MNCNCIYNQDNPQGQTTIIPHVFGNVLRLGIPLTKRTISLVDGEIEATDTDFIPSSDVPVKVIFTKGATRVALDATMKNGNVAFIQERGKIPVGTYAITVTCADDEGNPYRFKQNAVLKVVDTTAEAGIEKNIEYEVTTWYLDAAVFLALKGEDGVGIASIDTQSSAEVGGMNTVTFILTDGTRKSFTIMNGSGAVDENFDPNSKHPLSNDIITARFNLVDEKLSNVFGAADYDSNAKIIRFYNKDRSKVLATLDARPFIKDGMVNSVYISNNTLVITFNTDSGREAIGVPLTSVFNPNNYYNKTQVDNRIATAMAGVQVDTSGLMAKNEFVSNDKLKYDKMPAIALDYIVLPNEDGDEPRPALNCTYGSRNGHIIFINRDEVETDYGIQSGVVFFNNEKNAWYKWNGSAWQEVGNSGGSGGYNVSFDNGNVIFNGSNQPTYDNGNIIF